MATTLTQAQRMLFAGQENLKRQHPEPFTIEGRTETFIGQIEEARFGNELGEGGFTPGWTGTLFVTRPEFENAAPAIEPKIGMRITVYGLVFLVSAIATNRYRWALTLIHP
jgi:hypothetical protein